jgi:DNA polymerase-1
MLRNSTPAFDEGFAAGQKVGAVEEQLELFAMTLTLRMPTATAYDEGYLNGVSDARARPALADENVQDIINEQAGEYFDELEDQLDFFESFEVSTRPDSLKKLLLIDGDEFLFRAAAAVEQEVRFNEVLDEPDWNEPPIHVLFSNPVQARKALDEMLERIFERFGTDNHYLCFSSPPNFRFGVDPTYKNNRATSRKPLCYHQLRVDVEKDYTCKALPGLEADDVMGIFATCPGIKGQKIIVSQDKDMQTIPTQVWRQGDLVTISEAEADYYHMFQTLVGDTSDGYKGCPGVGKVKAEKLLDCNPNLSCGDT